MSKAASPHLAALGRTVGTSLAQVHQVTAAVRRFEAPPADWGTCLGLWDLVETTLFDTALHHRFELLRERTGYRTASPGTLTHSDANLHNVLVDQQDRAFRALIDPGPLIVGLPMYDLAVAAQPWRYGMPYLDTLIHAYQQAGGVYDATYFYLSLLCVAYQHSRDYHLARPEVRPLLTEYFLPQLAGAVLAEEP